MYHVEITKTYDGHSNLKGLAKLRLSDAFEINNIRIMQGQDGLFVAFPSKDTGKKDGGGKAILEEIIRPASKEVREQLKHDILEAYQAYRKPSLKISVTPVHYDIPSNIRAYAAITVDDMIQIHGIRLMENAQGKIFVSLPSYETLQDGERVFVDLASCLNGAARKDLEVQIEAQYINQLVEDKRKKIQDARQPGQRRTCNHGQ